MTSQRKRAINNANVPPPADNVVPPRSPPPPPDTHDSPEMTAAIACFTPTALKRLPVPLQTLVHDDRRTASSYTDLGLVLSQWYAGSTVCSCWSHLTAVVIGAHRGLRVAQRVVCSTVVCALSAIAACVVLTAAPRMSQKIRLPPCHTSAFPGLPPLPPPAAPRPATASRLQLPLAGTIGDNQEPAQPQPPGCTFPFLAVTAVVIPYLLRVLATAVTYFLSIITTHTLVCVVVTRCLPKGPAQPTDPTRHIRGDSVNPAADALASVSHPSVRGGVLVWDQEVSKRSSSLFSNQPWPQGRTEGCGVAGVCHNIIITNIIAHSRARRSRCRSQESLSLDVWGPQKVATVMGDIKGSLWRCSDVEMSRPSMMVFMAGLRGAMDVCTSKATPAFVDGELCNRW